MATPSSRRIYCTDCGAICPSTWASDIEAWMEEHARTVHAGNRVARCRAKEERAP